MATLTAVALAHLRRPLSRHLKRSNAPIDYDKPAINGVLQALEDWLEGQRSAINSAINGAHPALSAAQKKHIVGVYLTEKAKRELL